MSVDTLSDSEIRTKLMEYGYSADVPVTHTTRKILLKKLKKLIENQGGSRHSLAARYSSDETDDGSMSTNIRKKKASANLRRQTVANPMPPPPAITPDLKIGVRTPPKEKVLLSNSDFKDPMPPDFDNSSMGFSNRSITKSIQKKTTKLSNYKSSSMTDGLETGSDSDIQEEPNKTYPKSKYLATIGKTYESRSLDHSTGDNDQSTNLYESRSISMHSPKENKSIESSFKTNISPIQTSKEDREAYSRDITGQRDLLANYETPFLSEFTRRLSSRSNINLPSPSLSSLKGPSLRHTGLTSPEVKEKDSNGHFSSMRSTYSTTNLSPRHTMPSTERARNPITRKFKSANDIRDDVRNNQNMVSVILVVVLALFFGILAVIYLGLGGKTETLPSLSTDSNIPICFHGTSNYKLPGVNCVQKQNVDSVLRLLKQLQPILRRKAISAICDISNETPYLTDAEILNMFAGNKASSLEVREDLNGAQFLVIKNPHWGIAMVDVTEDNGGNNDVLDNLDALFSARVNGKVGMKLLNPDLPLQCLIKNKIFTLFWFLLIISLGVPAALGTHKLFLWYIKQKKCTEREVFKLVSEIIHLVETHHQNATVATPGGTQESFLAINHVRDNLIPPKDRKKMAGLWEKAVKFLDENESRIRREVQQVAGEEFHVWRWLPNNSLNKSTTQSPTASKKCKVWQGQAFETMEGSVNSLPCSPTPCLKIRHMFDPDTEIGDDWETKVQDAILEKCGEDVKILHIRVDRGNREGCVYMKCVSQEDAGKAYRALHGCWFDGHLVTVKYLRFERYHERFPDAIRCRTPLKPSNNQRLSMQAHYWQSPLETN